MKLEVIMTFGMVRKFIYISLVTAICQYRKNVKTWYIHTNLHKN